MNAAQPELEYPSEPITGETRATVDLVADDWRSAEDWERFTNCCLMAADLSIDNVVDPNYIRAMLTNEYGLTIEPRRYSAFWHRAASKKHGFLVADGWVTNTDHAGGNAGKP